MLSIPEKNETIYNVILNAITKQVGYRLLIEFGYYKYQIFPELNENSQEFKDSLLEVKIILLIGSKIINALNIKPSL